MKTAALFLLIAASVIGCTAIADEQDADPRDETIKQARELLAQRTDADSLGAAAMLTLLQQQATTAEQLAARASAAAPQRLDLLWLHAQLCGTVQGCDRKPIDAKLRALDPENGAPFLAALAGDRRPPDPAETDRILDALATTKRIDIYWNSLIGHLGGPVLSTGKLTPNESVAVLTGLAAFVMIPMYEGAARACRNELTREGRRVKCQGLARALLKGDTALTEIAGASLAPRLWPESSAEVRAAREARRVFDYRASLMGNDEGRLKDEAAARQYLEKLVRYKREQEVIVAEIVAAGRNPTPPADWKPAAPASASPAPAAPTPAPATR